MRLVLGDDDWILGPGEIAEFDTKTAALVRQHRRHDPAEILSIFGRPGERHDRPHTNSNDLSRNPQGLLAPHNRLCATDARASHRR